MVCGYCRGYAIYKLLFFLVLLTSFEGGILMAKEVVHFRREVMTRLIRAFYSDNFPEGVGTIVFDMRPKGYSPPTRCCIYHDRAVIRSRVIAALSRLWASAMRTMTSAQARRIMPKTRWIAARSRPANV